MEDHITILGMDVHKDTIVAAVLPAGQAQALPAVTVPNTPQALTKLVRQAGPPAGLHAVYEAGPCGFTAQRHLAQLGVRCAVVAPALTPVKPGDRVKTDRRDAAKLATLFRAGVLTAIHVPTGEDEALRDVVRVREDVMVDRHRARQQLGMFLLRQGRTYHGTVAWGTRHREWLASQRFDLPGQETTFLAYHRRVQDVEGHVDALTQQVRGVADHPRYRALVAGLRALKGLDTLGATTLAVEVQDFRRFPTAPSFMSYTGLVVREHSSGPRQARGNITKAGNAHVRRILVEAAWSYRRVRTTHGPLLERRQAVSPDIARVARKAEARLHEKFWRLVSRNRPSQVAVIAVARELAGFVWAVAHLVPSATV